MPATIIWFTGLSGSGKSTLANLLFRKLKKNKKRKIKLVDGDTYRKKTNKKFPLTKKNIIDNNLSIIRYINKIKFNYNIIIVSVIAPLSKTRILARETFKKKYLEVYLYCKISTLKSRDPKGYYRKKMKMIGVNSPIKYEKTYYKKIKVNTDLCTKTQAVRLIINKINLI
tara:strand:- start:9562 stop:10071 length:510 start_codon:yes stop_codon:yes gene_type:complete